MTIQKFLVRTQTNAGGNSVAEGVWLKERVSKDTCVLVSVALLDTNGSCRYWLTSSDPSIEEVEFVPTVELVSEDWPIQGEPAPHIYRARLVQNVAA